MRKFLLICFTFFAYITLNAQSDIRVYYYNEAENTVELDLKKIDNYYERLYLLYSINNDSRFVTTSTDEYGLFYISSADETPDSQNFSEVFEMFFQTKLSDFNSFDKLTIAETEKVWKDGIANFDILSLMMDIMMDGAPRGNNDSCYKAEPFCTDNGLYTFQAVTGNNHPSESGPSYNCLSSQPCPSWYYMKISTPGNFTIHMEGKDGTTQRDIDFCCWGPFNDPIAPCPHIPGPNPNGLTADKVVDCSYSSSYSENCDIPSSAQTGQYYILIITNFSTQRCIITFSKAEGSGPGTTDCSIMPPAIDHSNPCYGETMQLTAQEVNNATYSWTGPNGFTASIREPQIQNVTFSNSGTYTCSITVPGQGTSEPMTMDVEILPTLTADFTNDDFCIGVEGTFTGSESTTPSGHESAITGRIWDFGDGSDPVSGATATHTFEAAGTYQVTYTIVAANATGGTCGDVKEKTITVYDIPVADAGENQNIYYGTPATLTAAAVSGASYAWTPVNMIDGNPNQQTVQTVPMTGAQTFHLTVTSAHGCVNEDEVSVSVGEQMTADVECDNAVICSDETTTLIATATGGTNNFSFSWEPDNLVDNPTSATTIARPTNTTTFTCNITDGVDIITKTLTITVNPVLYTPMEYTVCEQMLPYPITLPDGSVIEIGEEHPASNPYETIVYTEQGCKNYVSIILNISDMVSYTETHRECNQGFDWIDNLATSPTYGTVVYHFEETEDKTIIFETEPCYTQVTMKFTRDPEYSDPYSYTGGVFDAGESCEPFIWNYVNSQTHEPVTRKFEESFDDDIVLNTMHGCDSIVHFSFTRHHMYEEQNPDAHRVDTCKNADGFFIWGSKYCSQGDIINGDVWTNENDFQTIHGCDSIARIRLRLFDQPNASKINDADEKLVQSGSSWMPLEYKFEIKDVTGAGMEQEIYPTNYIWSIHFHPDWGVPDCSESWILNADNTSQASLMVLSPGNATIVCQIPTICGVIYRDIFVYTSEYGVEETSYNNRIGVFPNPTNGMLYIGFDNVTINTPMTISIYNSNGMLIDSFVSANNTDDSVIEYSMSNLADGLYFIKVTGKDFNVVKRAILSR